MINKKIEEFKNQIRFEIEEYERRRNDTVLSRIEIMGCLSESRGGGTVNYVKPSDTHQLGKNFDYLITQLHYGTKLEVVAIRGILADLLLEYVLEPLRNAVSELRDEIQTLNCYVESLEDGKKDVREFLNKELNNQNETPNIE